MIEKNNNPVVGTGIKLSISMPPVDDVRLVDVDFDVLVYTETGFRKSLIKKDEAIYVDEDTYVICVDTDKTGAGKLYTLVTVYIPDSDFPDGVRPEKHKRYTGIVIDPQ